MHIEMSFEYLGEPNVDFARGMIPHHEGALEMCYTLFRSAERHPDLDALCNNVVNAQTLEISELSSWLQVRSG